MKAILTHTIAVSNFFKGFMILSFISLPLTLLITFFIAVMGAANPDKPGFLKSLGIAAGFIYVMPLGVLVWLVVFGKVFDVIFRIVPLATSEVSCSGIFIAAIGFVIAGNIFIDHLYQFKQGNYRISFFALLITLIYAVIVYFSAKIPIPWIFK